MSNIANIQEIIRRLQTDVTAPLFWKQNMVKLLEGGAPLNYCKKTQGYAK